MTATVLLRVRVRGRGGVEIGFGVDREGFLDGGVKEKGVALAGGAVGGFRAAGEEARVHLVGPAVAIEDHAGDKDQRGGGERGDKIVRRQEDGEANDRRGHEQELGRKSDAEVGLHEGGFGDRGDRHHAVAHGDGARGDADLVAAQDLDFVWFAHGRGVAETARLGECGWLAFVR